VVYSSTHFCLWPFLNIATQSYNSNICIEDKFIVDETVKVDFHQNTSSADSGITHDVETSLVHSKCPYKNHFFNIPRIT